MVVAARTISFGAGALSFGAGALKAIIVVLFSLSLAGCGSSSRSERLYANAPSPEWYRERHEDVVRDFYGYQIRTGQKRQQRVVAKTALTDRWWVSQRRRVTAREVVVERDQRFERNFFLMQERQVEGRSRGGMTDERAREAFLASQARASEELQQRILAMEAAQQKVLEGESARRREQMVQLQESRRSEARLANRRLAPVRGQSFSRRRVIQPIGQPISPAIGTGAPATQTFGGGATTAAAGGGTGIPGTGGQTASAP